ncbi:hypothetical protein [Peribacillus sp. NPDC058002]|uniref:hypothetical protein n=1 Tax=Peribacillus sp. NPDC058002 TaxID=3346301 RepID=UPI0036D9561A
MKNSGWEESGENLDINNYVNERLCGNFGSGRSISFLQRRVLFESMDELSLEDWKRYGIDGWVLARQII